MRSLPYRVRSDDHENFSADVLLDDDLPRLASMVRLDDPPTINDILAIPGGTLEHTPQINFVESSILHSFEQVGAELQLPVPPLGPHALTQSPSPSFVNPAR